MYFIFDGYSFENILEIEKTDLGIVPNRTNHTFSISPDSHGEHYRGFKYEPKVIEVTFNVISDIPDDFVEERRLIGSKLHVKEPKKLVFSWEPEVYWLAVPDGEVSLEESMRLGHGSISFLCVEPYAFSQNEKRYELHPTSKYLNVLNEGVIDTPIKVQAFFDKSDSGVFSILNSTQVFSFGSKAQVDSIQTERTEKIMHDEMDNLVDWYTDDSIMPISFKRVPVNTGSIITTRYGAYLSSMGTYTESNSGWGGKQLIRDLPLDKANSRNHMMFNLGGRMTMKDSESGWKATGLMYVAVLDDQNDPIAFIKWWDSDIKRRTIAVQISYVEKYEDGTLEVVPMRREYCEEYSGDFSMVQENKGRGWNMYIRVYNGESGNVFYNNNRYFFRTAPRPAHKVLFFVGNNSSDITLSDYDSMGSTAMYFRKYFPDVPDGQVRTVDAENYFMEGDEATFDMETGQTFINGIPEVEGRAVDSDLIYVPSGNTTLGFDWSDWAKQPRVFVSFRERYLS